MLTKADTLEVLEPVVRRNTKHFNRSWKIFKGQVEAGSAEPVSYETLERERIQWNAAHGKPPRDMLLMVSDDVPQTPQTQRDAAARQNGQSPRPVIQITTNITAMVDAGQQAIIAMANPPRLYQRARQLCFIARGVKTPKWLNRPHDAPVIVEATSAYLLELAVQAAQWQKFDRRKNRWFPAMPPTRELLDVLMSRGQWDFPRLEAIVHSPTMRPDGSILTTPGYDPDTGLYLDMNGTAFPDIPHKPDWDHARAAIATLHEVFQDFPFLDARIHYSAALAGTISLVCRFAVQGNVPMFAARSTTRGSGKGLLVDAISLIGTSRLAPRWPQTSDEEEERKRLLTLALDGDPLVLIDNVTQPLGSAALDAAITARVIKDRILGRTQSKEAPMHAVFFTSGNNMVFKGDMARRVVPIDLDPKMEKPEERNDFTHPRLLTWIRANRPRLVCAALTVLAAYFKAGCPTQGIKPLGSFEEWSDLVRSALVWAGEADPCEGRKDIEAESDPEFEAYHTLLTCWEDCYKNEATTLNQAAQDCGWYAVDSSLPDKPQPNTWNALRDALGAFDERCDGKGLHTKKIGNALRRYHGRVVDGKRLVKDGEYRRAIKWRLESV
jgi:putative DNA primase/helicase